MVIRGNHSPPETLVTHNRLVHPGIEYFLNLGLVGHPHQFQVVGIRFGVDKRLLPKRRLGLLGKAGLDENLPQGGAGVRLLEEQEQLLIEPRTKYNGPELTDAATLLVWPSCTSLPGNGTSSQNGSAFR
jgi:hypothetical protein